MSAVTTRCLWCGTAGVSGNACRRCNVQVAAPVYIEPTHGCPRCKTPLEAHPIANDVTVHACSAEHTMYRGPAAAPPTTCRGVFVSPYAWSRIVGEPVLAEHVDARLSPTMNRGALVPMARCPVCKTEMERGPFAAKSNIIIDVCPNQHGMWLDAGELPGTLSYIMAEPPLGAVVNYGPASPQQIREQVNLQVSKFAADSAMRKARSKELAVIFGVVVVLLRVGWWVLEARHSPSKEQQKVIEEQSNQL